MSAPPTDGSFDVAEESLSRPQLEERARALLTVNAIADVILTAVDARDVLGAALEAIACRTRFPAIAVYRTNEPARRLDLLCSRGFAQTTELAGSSLPLEGSLSGSAVRGRKIVTSPDVGREADVPIVLRQRLAEEGFSAALCVPLLMGEHAIGTMNLLYKGREVGVSGSEREMLTSIGKAIAMAIERSRFVRCLDQERQRSDATLRSIGDAVVVTDARGLVTLMNPAAERLTRWSEKEALGRSVEDIFRIYDEKTRAPVENPVSTSLRTREFVKLADSAVLLARDGTERDVVDSCAPILDTDRHLEGAVLAFHDVTRPRRDQNWLAFMHEASLLLARSLDYETTLGLVARLAVASLADVCVVDLLQPDGTIRRLAGAHADPAKQPLVDDLVRLACRDPSALEGVTRSVRMCQPALYDLSDDAMQARYAAYLGSGREYFRALTALDLGSGLVVPLLVEDSRALGAITLGSRGVHRFEASDVQRAQQLAHCFALAIENARLHREMQDSLAMREEFLNLVAHELKTPITALQLDLAAIEKGFRAHSDTATADRLARPMEQVRRLVRLAECMLDVSVLSPERVVLQLENVDLRQVVADAVERYREDAQRTPVPRLRPGPPVLWRCDRRLLARAIANLLLNAAKFGEGRPIELSVEVNGDAVARIHVIDHGIGVSPDDVPRIFEPFERAVSSRHYGGLGLGLHVAQGIVQAHGGSILVASERNAGSTFTVLLPPAAQDCEEKPPAPAGAPSDDAVLSVPRTSS